MLAKSLGRAMPFWYAVVQVMLGVEAYLRRGQANEAVLMGAAMIWGAVIVATILWLVPLSNRIAARDADWKALHRTWDARHRVRVAALLVALSAATFVLGGGGY